jgi:hypothetical protein
MYKDKSPKMNNIMRTKNKRKTTNTMTNKTFNRVKYLTKNHLNKSMINWRSKQIKTIETKE